jgi:hypothetical protein
MECILVDRVHIAGPVGVWFDVFWSGADVARRLGDGPQAERCVRGYLGVGLSCEGGCAANGFCGRNGHSMALALARKAERQASVDGAGDHMDSVFGGGIALDGSVVGSLWEANVFDIGGNSACGCWSS